MASLLEPILAGNVRALARGISLVEEGSPGSDDLLKAAFGHTGRAAVYGITGPPGAGKSSLVDRLIRRFRSNGSRVGVVAIDPSSAYSGGAILGDRIRMQDHATDEGVFIRSMATRGHLGGLSRATSDAVDLMDAAGYDPILIETVGVGQDEIEVVRAADVVAVVLVPGMGDDIQAIKAGILEIADLFVINKADLAGADRLAADLDFMLSLVNHHKGPKPEIYRTVAVRDEGVAELIDAIEGFARRFVDSREGRRRDRAEARFKAILSERLVARVLSAALDPGALDDTIERIAARRTDPYTAVDEVLSKVEVK